VTAGLEAYGVDVRTSTAVTAVNRNGGVRVELGDGSTEEADELLLALGRRPRTKDLGLETVGLEPGRPIAVDDAMRAEASGWLYAAGDVNGRTPFTHMGK
jgi:pyruvate/2-oxoglutarate dehydrogenase complex dihydrolipoamide dehydrogenase (E3) component